jgi:hypothetical protein
MIIKEIEDFSQNALVTDPKHFVLKTILVEFSEPN